MSKDYSQLSQDIFLHYSITKPKASAQAVGIQSAWTLWNMLQRWKSEARVKVSALYFLIKGKLCKNEMKQNDRNYRNTECHLNYIICPQT